MFYGVSIKLEPLAIISLKKVIFGWISRLNEAKIDWKFSDKTYGVSNNAIT